MKRTILDDLITLPWWVNLVLALLVYLGLRYLLPYYAFQNPFLHIIARMSQGIAGLFAMLLVLVTALSLYHSWRKGELLDTQSSIKSIQQLSWKDFEFLIGEAYRRRGFSVRENTGAGADGGIDIVLSKDGKTTLVQCKNWKAQSVGVGTVRELYGVLTAERASEGIVVCSGNFTKDAAQFAIGKPLTLVDGASLTKLIGDVQRLQKMKKQDSPSCPLCESPMLIRTAKKGESAGRDFWGCSNFPKCRGTRAIES